MESSNAFNQLMQLWYKKIYNYSYRQLHEHDLAQEVTQKTFIKAYEKLGTLQDDSRFTPWIYRIANNFCTDEARKFARMNQLKKVFSGSRLQVVESPEQQYQQNESKMVIRALLDQLPAAQKTVLVMKEYEGLKFREIAEILGESENTVKSRLYYGLTTLKKLIKENNIQKEQLI